MLYATFKTQEVRFLSSTTACKKKIVIFSTLDLTVLKESQVLNENARKPLSIGYLAFFLCSDILAALSVF